MWYQQYERMDGDEKANFAEYVNKLLSSGFLCDRVWNRKIDQLDQNPAFSFAQHYEAVFSGYFAVMNWKFSCDTVNGVIHIVNNADAGRIRMSDLQTKIVYTLYLLYEEKRRQIGTGMYVAVIASDVMAKLRNVAGIEKVPATRWEEALSFLGRYQILQRIQGEWKDPECNLLINPSILHLITPETIHALHAEFVSSGEMEAGQ